MLIHASLSTPKSEIVVRKTLKHGYLAATAHNAPQRWILQRQY